MHNRLLIWARGGLSFHRRRNKWNSCLDRDPHLGVSKMVLGSELERLSAWFRRWVDGSGAGGRPRGISLRVYDTYGLVRDLVLS